MVTNKEKLFFWVKSYDFFLGGGRYPHSIGLSTGAPIAAYIAVRKPVLRTSVRGLLDKQLSRLGHCSFSS